MKVTAESPSAGVRRLCCRAFLTFVALGADGKPAKAPLLLTETGEEERRAWEAEARREERLARQSSGTPLP